MSRIDKDKNKFSNGSLAKDNPAFDESKQKLDVECVELETLDKKESDQSRQISLVELFQYSDAKDKVLLLIGCITAVGSACVYLLMFFLYGQVASTFIDQEKFNRLNTTLNNSSLVFDNESIKCFDLDSSNFDNRIETSILNYVYFGLSSILLTYLSYACFDTSAERQLKRIRNNLFLSLLRQEMAFYDKNSPGELSSRITANVETLKLGMGFKIAEFISLIGRGIGCLIYALISAWKFSIVALAIMPFISVSTAFMISFIKKFTIKELESYGISGKIAQEVLSSIRVVLSFGSMRKEIKNYETNLENAEKMSIKKGLYTGFFTGLALFLFNCVFALGIYYGTYLSRDDCVAFPPASILRSLLLMVTATFSIGQGLPFLKDLSEARAAASTVFQIIEKKSQIDIFDKENKIRPDTFKGNITFSNVSFSYPQRKEVKILNKLSMTIPAGKTVALCGASGGGKSTIIQLLQRFYEPQSGSIKLDKKEIKDLDLEWLREQMALVSQEPVLFSTTIRENIRLGRLDATDEEIEKAAKSANAHSFIMTCPNKYDTQVGERGSQLSGGQKQRIAIARAILRNPKILLLDEATSALDYESEKIVQDALEKAKVGRTTIIIAHRLSTIQNADIIMSLVDGKVIEEGSHENLMALKGKYYELVTSQSSQKDDKLVSNQKKIKPNPVFKLSESDLSEDETEGEIIQAKESVNKIEVDKNVSHPPKISNYKLALKLWPYHSPEKYFILLGAVSQLLAGIVNPVVSIIFTEIYTIFALPEEEQIKKSLTYMLLILGISVANFLVNISYNYCFSLLGARLTKRLRLKMFESYLRQEVAYHDLDEHKSSILATQLASSVPFCKGLTTDMLSIICQAISSVGFSIIVGMVINVKLCLIIMAFIPVNFLSGFINIQSSTNKVKNRTNEEETGRLTTEVVENIKTVVSLGRENYFNTLFRDTYEKKFKKLLILLQIRAFLFGLSNSVLFFIQASAFSFGFKEITRGNLNVTNLFRVYATITFSSMTLGRLFAQMPDFNKARQATRTALKVINRKSKIDSMSDKGLKPTSLEGHIEFKNVKFRYPNRPEIPILNGLNIRVKPGQVNALVGPSGCGKSTAISLLMRFYDVDEGQVLLDGVDIRNLNIQWLRSNVGIVSQEPVLFNLSIKENICYGKIDEEQVKMSEIVHVAKSANIYDRIQSLPENFDTIVGTKGGQLSGGEKQRVAIARALLRQPKILLLDEATSALDNYSEKIVQDALDKAEKGRTCLVIAHRLSTIENSDIISVIQNGRVVEQGTHSELIKLKNIYFKLQNSKS
uniref:ATP-binding cassette transporter subfamily B member 1-like protein X12 n=1 Tax=Brachionus rotundiformis TaxID=96890 RepID=A0A7H9SKV1_9BILA|nr:ATP-binding cassette transporter subfamily B member 1-like protein X12 [Brachionus rotundiformis]